MLRRTFLAVSLLCWAGAALGGTVIDATGRSIELPDHVARVLPAGPPAAILLAAVAPDLMLGWTSPVSDNARALLSPEAVKLPQVPRLTGRDDVSDKIAALKPDLILDYGTIAPRYIDLAKATQQRTGVPTVLLDGSLAEVPHVFRLLGGIFHREERAEILARFAEALLTMARKPDFAARIVCARGPDGLNLVAPGTDLAETFTRAGWKLVAPPQEPRGKPAWMTSAYSILMSSCSPILQCVPLWPNPKRGSHCVPCAMATLLSHPTCRSAGSTNRHPSTGCSALPGWAAVIRARSPQRSTPWSTVVP